MLLLKLLILAVLLFIFIQDIKSRSVYWILFPILTILLLGLNIQQQSVNAAWKPVMINIGFLIAQLLIVSAYFSLKRRQWINLTTGLLGWGDILFLVSVAFYLSVLNFLFFYVISLSLILTVWLIWQNFVKNKKIPLAGLQALLFAVFLASSWWLVHLQLTDDEWLLKYLFE